MREKHDFGLTDLNYGLGRVCGTLVFPATANAVAVMTLVWIAGSATLLITAWLD